MLIKESFKKYVNEYHHHGGFPPYVEPKNKLGKKQWQQWNTMTKDISNQIKFIKDTAEGIRNEFNYRLHSRDYRENAYEFNVKMYDIPGVDVEELLNKYFDGSEDDLDQTWVDFVGRQVEHFVEDLQDHHKIDWIKDYYQVGRSGGWLVLELEPYTWSEGDVEDKLNEMESDWNYESEELVEYNDETETFKADMKEMKKLFKRQMKAISIYESELTDHAEELNTIKKQIPIVQAGMGQAFKAQIEGNA